MSQKIKVLLVVLLILGCLIGGYFLYKNLKLSWFQKKSKGTEIVKTDPTIDPNKKTPPTKNGDESIPADKNFVVYKINSESITEGEIENEILKITPPNFETQMQSIPPNDQRIYRSKLRDNAIKNLTSQAYIRLFLRDQKITITQAEIDKTKKDMEDMIRQNFEKSNPGKPFILADQLKEFGVSMETFMTDVNNQTMFLAATSPFLSKITAVTDSEVKDYFNKNKETYNDPPKADIKHILLNSEAEADSIMDQLKNGKNFEEVAIKNSKDPQVSQNSGKIGWVPKNYMPENMANIIFDPSTKLLSPYKIQVNSLWYVVEVLGFQPEVTKTFEEVKSKVKDDCLQDKKMKALDDFFVKQEGKYGKPVLQTPKPN